MCISIEQLAKGGTFYDTRSGELVEVGDLSDNVAVSAQEGHIAVFYPWDRSIGTIEVKDALKAFTEVTDAAEVLFGRGTEEGQA